MACPKHSSVTHFSIFSHKLFWSLWMHLGLTALRAENTEVSWGSLSAHVVQNNSYPSTALRCGLGVLSSQNWAIWVLDVARLGTAQGSIALDPPCVPCSTHFVWGVFKNVDHACYVIHAKHKELHLFSFFCYGFVFVSCAPAMSHKSCWILLLTGRAKEKTWSCKIRRSLMTCLLWG